MVSLRNKKNYPELSSNTLSYLELWARCSKLTMSLVNVSLNFQTLILQICQYFLLKKM